MQQPAHDRGLAPGVMGEPNAVSNVGLKSREIEVKNP
jgi:hypothetical protein